MAKRAIKVSIALLYLLQRKVRQASLRLIGKSLQSSATILMYHAVRQEDRNPFTTQMKWLHQNMQPASLEDVTSAAPDSRQVAITFDDAYVCLLENALPVLRELHIPATIFVPTQWIDRERGWESEGYQDQNTYKVMSASSIQALAEEGVCMESHTLNHKNLTKLQDTDAALEISQSKDQLQSMTQHPVKHLAFPYGAYQERHVEMAMTAGYSHVYAAVPVIENGTVMGRIDTSPSDWMIEFQCKARGGYQWLPMAISLKQKLWRIVKRT